MFKLNTCYQHLEEPHFLFYPIYSLEEYTPDGNTYVGIRRNKDGSLIIPNNYVHPKDYTNYKECIVENLKDGDRVLLRNGVTTRFNDAGCVVGAFELTSIGYVEYAREQIHLRSLDGRALDCATWAPLGFEDKFDVIAILERAKKVEDQPEQESNLIDKMLTEQRNVINPTPIKRYVAFAGRIGISEGGWDDVIYTSDVYEDVLKKATLIWRLDTSNIWFQIVDTFANRKLAWAKGNEITGAVL